MTSRLICIRHGQTTWNATGRIQGQQTDAALSDLGRHQAILTAETLKGAGMTALYTSDLGRAQETAETIAGQVGLQPIVDPRLREQSFGDLEGHYWKDVPDMFPEVHAGMQANDFHMRIPGGESRADLVERAVMVMNTLADTGGTIGVVTHGGLLRFFLRNVLQVPESMPAVARIPNCSISDFRRQHGRWRLWTWASVHHLRSLERA